MSLVIGPRPLRKLRQLQKRAWRVYDYCQCGYCGCPHEARAMFIDDARAYIRRAMAAKKADKK